MDAVETVKAIEKVVREYFTPALIDDIRNKALDKTVADLEGLVGHRVRVEVQRILGQSPSALAAEAQVWATLTLAAVGMEDYSLAQSYRERTEALLVRMPS